MNQDNKTINEVSNNQSITSTSVSEPKTSQRKKSPTKKSTVKKDNQSTSKKELIAPVKHLIVGQHVNSETGFSFACSESSSFREIMIDFAKTIDISANKVKSTLFADILANLNNNDTNTKMVFLLLEEMFGYKVLLISEISKLYYGKDFLNQLKQRMNDKNEPLPF